MSNIRFINKKSQQFHNIKAQTDQWLLIVQCTALGEALMTQDAYSTLMHYLSHGDRQGVQLLEITPDSAARLGYSRVWTADDIESVFGPKSQV